MPVSKIILVFKNSSMFRARQRQDPVQMGIKKRSPIPVNRFPFTARANVWEKSWLLPMRMNFRSSSFGLLGFMDQGIKISLLFLNASPKGSTLVLSVRINILAYVMCRILSGGFYWPPELRQRAEKYFSYPMETTIGCKKSAISSPKPWESQLYAFESQNT